MIGLAILIILLAPKGIWGYVIERWSLSLFPSGYRVIEKENP
jgi:branched-chain amino acid transport system permease protein